MTEDRQGEPQSDGPKTASTAKPSPLSSPEIGELVGALALASLKFKPLLKDATNPHFNSKFAGLATCIKSVRDALADHGLAVVQPLIVRGETCFLRTVLAHKSGQFLGSEIPIQADWNNPQKIGSALTYLRRYSLCSMLDIAADDDDDDGNGASGGHPSRDATRPHQNGSAGYSSQRSGQQSRPKADDPKREAPKATAAPDYDGPRTKKELASYLQAVDPEGNSKLLEFIKDWASGKGWSPVLNEWTPDMVREAYPVLKDRIACLDTDDDGWVKVDEPAAASAK